MRLISRLAVTLAAAALFVPHPALAWQHYDSALLGPVDAKLDGNGTLYVLFADGMTVQRFDAETGSGGWSSSLPSESGRGLAVDDNGDVIGVGSTSISDLLVRKLDGTTGSEEWRQDFASGSGHDIVALPGVAGDVVASGSLGGDFFVRRLNGADGTTAWTYQASCTGGLATALALDGSGNVVAAGTCGTDFTVAKIDLATGAEIWLTQVPSGTANAVVVAGNGDIIAGGTLDDDFAVLRFDASGGSELWRRLRGGNAGGFDTVRALDLDASGDVFAVGFLFNFLGQDLAVMKIAGGVGSQIWLREITGGSNSVNDNGNSVATLPSGDAIIGGTIHRLSGAWWGNAGYLARLDGSTGASAWAHVISNPYNTNGQPVEVRPLVFDGVAHVYAAIGDVGSAFAVARFGIDGTPGLISGKALLIKDKAGFTDKRRISVRSVRDALFITPPPGSANDPITAGATIKIVNPTSGENATFVLPPGGAFWQGLGNPAGSQGYKYKDLDYTNGPCNLVIAKPGKLLKMKCSSREAAIPFSLDEPTQGTITISIAFGSGLPQCTAFGTHALGTFIRRDAGTSNPGPAGLFKVLGSPYYTRVGASCTP